MRYNWESQERFIMKKAIWILTIILMVATGLSGCGDSGLSNKQLKEDILNLNELALVTDINELTVIEKVQDKINLVYKLDTTLESYNSFAKANINLNYTKTNGKWVLSGNTISIVSVSAKNDPSVTQAVKSIIKPISERLLNHWGNGYQAEYKLTSSTGSKESGMMTIVISEKYSDDYYTVGADYTLDAVYDFKTGWSYTLKDWVYTETMKWAGTYNVTWTQSDPGWPSGETSKNFGVGDKINGLKIVGTGSSILHMDETKEIQNDYVITFTYKDKDYRVLPIIEWSASELWVDLNSDLTDDYMHIYYDPNPPGDSDNYFVIEAAFIIGEMEKIN